MDYRYYYEVAYYWHTEDEIGTIRPQEFADKASALKAVRDYQEKKPHPYYKVMLRYMRWSEDGRVKVLNTTMHG